MEDLEGDFYGDLRMTLRRTGRETGRGRWRGTSEGISNRIWKGTCCQVKVRSGPGGLHNHKGGATLNILALNRRLLKHTVSLNILGEWVIQKL